jgi:Pentapeptide repeats (8 copies)
LESIAVYEPRCSHTIDLSETDLRDADLRKAHLTRANLRRTDLRKADLTDAYLGGANLSSANLSWADLSKAILNSADLTEANLNRSFCAPGQAPQYVFGFADPKARIGDAMADPVTCEFPDPNGTGDIAPTHKHRPGVLAEVDQYADVYEWLRSLGVNAWRLGYLDRRQHRPARHRRARFSNCRADSYSIAIPNISASSHSHGRADPTRTT